LNDLVRLLAEGANQERRGDLALARESYRKAVSLDGYSQTARLALARAEGNLTEVAFGTAMSKAIEALNREDYVSARGFFEEAAKIRPGDSQVLGGIAQADEGIRLQAIASHRENALRLEGQEDWHQAAKEYEAVLQLDPTIRFAREGKARSDERAALVDRIRYHIAHPERLSDEKVLTAAAALVDEAEGIQAPRLRSQRAQLADLVRQASTAVPVILESDNQTDVVVYQVGTLGRFVRHTLELRPGTYTVVGSRPGYRDVRVSLRVEAGKEPQPLIVRCEEEI
jgi:tetratricopeptide (TPR) repeat protein